MGKVPIIAAKGAAAAIRRKTSRDAGSRRRFSCAAIGSAGACEAWSIGILSCVVRGKLRLTRAIFRQPATLDVEDGICRRPRDCALRCLGQSPGEAPPLLDRGRYGRVSGARLRATPVTPSRDDLELLQQ